MRIPTSSYQAGHRNAFSFATDSGGMEREAWRGDGCVAERLAVFRRCFRVATIFSLWSSVKFPALRHAYLLTN